MPDYPKQPKWAVYYGTIILDDGTPATYTAAQVAAFYNLGSDPYTAVPLVGASPFSGGIDSPNSEVSYYHLKPQPDGKYYDAHIQYNTSGAEYLDVDFDTKRKDKWVHRKRFYDDDEVI